MSRGDDDEVLKRMFASFVERKINTRAQASNAAAGSSRPQDATTTYPMSPPHLPTSSPNLRRTASAHPRAAPQHGAPGYGAPYPPQQPPPVQPSDYHPRTTHFSVSPYGQGPGSASASASASAPASGPYGGGGVVPFNSNSGPGSSSVSGVNKSLSSLLAPGSGSAAHHMAGPSAMTSNATAAARNRARDGSRGALVGGGSNASDDATGVRPPRKRTRTNSNALMRTRSAHASMTPSGAGQWPASPGPSRNAEGSSVGSAAGGSPSVMSQPGSFPCDECGSVFTQKGQLSRHHRRVHEKLRPHACEHCGRLFGARSDRSRHVQIVHKTTPR